MKTAPEGNIFKVQSGYLTDSCGIKCRKSKYMMLVMLYRKIEGVGVTVADLGGEIFPLKAEKSPQGKYLEGTEWVSEGQGPTEGRRMHWE
jgi:hypothetical protein